MDNFVGFWPPKLPNARLDYQFDWNPWLNVGETIQSFNVTAPTGIDLGDGNNGSPAPAEVSGIVTFWLFNGSLNGVYQVVCQITTNGNRVVEKYGTLEVRR